ncbi:hypothetical protein SAMN05216599_106166 [Pseudomonas cichorii]|nr:hypothetical protein SAMN05216599_106166 [Pseudomonas cichorii]
MPVENTMGVRPFANEFAPTRPLPQIVTSPVFYAGTSVSSSHDPAGPRLRWRDQITSTAELRGQPGTLSSFSSPLA